MPEQTLLLLTPSRGFGGGAERVADAVEHCWQGPVVRVDLYRKGVTPDAHGNPRAKLGFGGRSLVRSLRTRPHTVLVLHAGLLPVALAAARPWAASVNVVGMGLEVWGDMSPLRRTLLRRVRLAAISSYTAKGMARRANVPERCVSVISLPVSEAFAQVARAGCDRTDRLDENQAGLVLLTVSRLVRAHRYKGLFVVADALPAVLREQPETRWVVVGSGDDLERLRQRCDELGISGSVDFLGAIGDEMLIATYRSADIFVLPSVADAEATPPIGEGFGLVYAEAGCFAVPSIACSQGGGALDFVRHNVNGVLVPPDDPHSLAREILRLARDPSLRLRLGSATLRRVTERHLPEHFSDALAKLLAR